MPKKIKKKALKKTKVKKTKVKKTKESKSKKISSKFKILSQFILAILGISLFVYFIDYTLIKEKFLPHLHFWLYASSHFTIRVTGFEVFSHL